MEESPFVTVWEAPRATIRAIVDADPTRHVNLLFFADGALAMLELLRSHAGDLGMAPALVAALCVATGIASVPLSHAAARWLGVAGRMLGGVASGRDVAAAFAWGSVPDVVGGIALAAIACAVVGPAAWMAGEPAKASAPLLVRTLSLASEVTGLWTLAASVVCYAEVNRFSLTRAMAAPIVGLVLVAVGAFVPVAIVAAYLTTR